MKAILTLITKVANFLFLLFWYPILSCIYSTDTTFLSHAIDNSTASTTAISKNSFSSGNNGTVMMCTGNATVFSHNGVDNAANAAGASDGNYAELYQLKTWVLFKVWVDSL